MTEHPNIPLLRKCVEWVEEQDALPGKGNWDQATFIDGATFDAIEAGRAVVMDCGTKACVCGHLAALNGAVVTWSASRVYERFDGLSPIEYGARELSISRNEAIDLFAAENTAADVRRIAEGIAAKVGERL